MYHFRPRKLAKVGGPRKTPYTPGVHMALMSLCHSVSEVLIGIFPVGYVRVRWEGKDGRGSMLYDSLMLESVDDQTINSLLNGLLIKLLNSLYSWLFNHISFPLWFFLFSSSFFIFFYFQYVKSKITKAWLLNV